MAERLRRSSTPLRPRKVELGVMLFSPLRSKLLSWRLSSEGRHCYNIFNEKKITIMNNYIILISNRRHPMDDKFYVKCESKERAKEVARAYDNNEFYIKIYELGQEIDF